MKRAIRKVWTLLPGRARLRIARAVQPKFTVSAAVFVVSDRRVLLLDHVLRPFSGWGLPGGFVGHGEQPEEAIRRELMEETGIELADLRHFRTRTVGRHIEILFTAAPVGEAKVRSREIIDLGWFAAEELPEAISQYQKEMMRKVLAGAD